MMCTSQLAYAGHKEHVASGLYSKAEVNKNISIDLHGKCKHLYRPRGFFWCQCILTICKFSKVAFYWKPYKIETQPGTHSRSFLIEEMQDATQKPTKS